MPEMPRAREQPPGHGLRANPFGFGEKIVATPGSVSAKAFA